MQRRIRAADVLRAYDATGLQPLCGGWTEGCRACPVSVVAVAAGVTVHAMRWARACYGPVYVTAFLHAFDRAPCPHCASAAASRRSGPQSAAIRDGVAVRRALEDRFGTIAFVAV